MRLRHLCLLLLCSLLAGSGCHHRCGCLRRHGCCTPCCSPCCDSCCGYPPGEAIPPHAVGPIAGPPVPMGPPPLANPPVAAPIPAH